MTGLQLAELLLADRPARPIVLASAYAELPPGALRLRRLQKPFSQGELSDAIADALERSRKRQGTRLTTLR